jgi:hypothetical protein
MGGEQRSLACFSRCVEVLWENFFLLHILHARINIFLITIRFLLFLCLSQSESPSGGNDMNRNGWM